MIRRLTLALPGGPLVRAGVLLVIAVAVLAGLVALYEWLGATLLDSGGTIG